MKTTKNPYPLATFFIFYTHHRGGRYTSFISVTVVTSTTTWILQYHHYNFVISHFIYTFRHRESHTIYTVDSIKHKAAPLSSLDATSFTITDNAIHSTINTPLYDSHTHIHTYNARTSFSFSILTWVQEAISQYRTGYINSMAVDCNKKILIL